MFLYDIFIKKYKLGLEFSWLDKQQTMSSKIRKTRVSVYKESTCMTVEYHLY